ncbi:hypothetical protein V498_09517 [Pseudogymnoascus sp. VKM F-4517 (FW-2822)]|nr:hypothetical protein V498_09517 [Pseudogymnoascus sp. VKM F-4517 (FW-2822)]
MSKQSSQSDSDITDEDEEFKEIERSKKKYDMFSYVAMGIPLNKEHRERQSKKSARASQHHTAKAKNQDINTPLAGLSQFDLGNDAPPSESSEHPHKWGQVLNPTTALVKDVRVYEDSGSSVNFISPSIVDACNLKRYGTKLIAFESVAGGVAFTANEFVELRWLGQDVTQGIDIFYIAPKATSIDLLVGRDFLRDNGDVFMSEKPTKPAYLNVPKKMTNDEKREMEANKDAATAKSAKLEETKRQKQREKEKEKAASSSKGGSSSGKKR